MENHPHLSQGQYNTKKVFILPVMVMGDHGHLRPALVSKNGDFKGIVSTLNTTLLNCW